MDLITDPEIIQHLELKEHEECPCDMCEQEREAPAWLKEQLSDAQDEIYILQEGSPNDIREAGWNVAVHNDYRLDGEVFTFWLFTHPDGRWVRGEGKTDAEALRQVRSAI